MTDEEKPKGKGGYRPGAGRKPAGLNRKRLVIHVTDEEREQILQMVKKLRNE